MKPALILGVVLCVVMSGPQRVFAQTNNPSDPAPAYQSGLDGSSYASLEGGSTQEMAKFIEKKWFSDLRSRQSTAGGATEIECTVKRDGRLGSVKIKYSSGNKELNGTAISAAKGAPPLKDLPTDFKGARFRLMLLYNLPSTPERPACNSMHPDPYKKPGHGVAAPKPIYSPDPEFSEAARKAKYRGSMTLALTVSPEGTAKDVCILRGLGMGLDEKAVEAVSRWKFKPGTENGQPVPVRIDVEVDFQLY
jgi:TonB family protein